MKIVLIPFSRVLTRLKQSLMPLLSTSGKCENRSFLPYVELFQLMLYFFIRSPLIRIQNKVKLG